MNIAANLSLLCLMMILINEPPNSTSSIAKTMGGDATNNYKQQTNDKGQRQTGWYYLHSLFVYLSR